MHVNIPILQSTFDYHYLLKCLSDLKYLKVMFSKNIFALHFFLFTSAFWGNEQTVLRRKKRCLCALFAQALFKVSVGCATASHVNLVSEVKAGQPHSHRKCIGKKNTCSFAVSHAFWKENIFRSLCLTWKSKRKNNVAILFY